MTDLEREFKNRYNVSHLSSIDVAEGEIPLLKIRIDIKSPVTILMTNGLSNYKMPVPDKLEGREYNELFFCLPSYWLLESKDDPNMNWVFYWIQRLAKYVQEKNTWFGPGHTMPCGNPFQALSPMMSANHFLLSDPILLFDELLPLKVADKTIHFLAIIPIFEDEMDYKQGKGTFKILKKFKQHGVTEKLDDFRGSIMKSKWRLIKK